MTDKESRRLTARIVAGVIPLRCRVAGREVALTVRHPSREQRLHLEERYEDYLVEASTEDLMTDDELLDFLWDNNIWNESLENSMRVLPADIEKLKVGLYESRHQQTVGAIREGLRRAREKYAEVFAKRHEYDFQTVTGTARMLLLRHRLAVSLYRGETRLFPDETWLEDREDFLTELLSAWQSEQLQEAQFRSLARSDAWRSVWQCRTGATSLFGLAACDYTDEQQQLVAVSQLFDNVREHPECPPDDVLADDDMLDGWLILERRKHKKSQDELDVEAGITSKEIRNSQEIYRVVNTKEQASRVRNLNSPQSQNIIDKRDKVIKAKGRVNEVELPDVKQRLQMERNRMASQS